MKQKMTLTRPDTWCLGQKAKSDCSVATPADTFYEVSLGMPGRTSMANLHSLQTQLFFAIVISHTVLSEKQEGQTYIRRSTAALTNFFLRSIP